jgi:hypothetical protein
MSDFNKELFGEFVARIGCGCAVLAIIVLIVTMLW